MLSQLAVRHLSAIFEEAEGNFFEEGEESGEHYKALWVVCGSRELEGT
jgi:hypothetical protein